MGYAALPPGFGRFTTHGGFCMFDKLFFGCLAAFLLLYGIAHVTNIQIVWMDPLTGLVALIAGVVGIIRVCK